MSDENQTQPEFRTIIIEAPSGEKFEASIPCDTRISKIAADFYEAQGWATQDQHGHRQRAVVELVNPENEDETKRLNGDDPICQADIQNGDTLRIFSESIAGVDEHARQRALVTDHRDLETMCERDPHITFVPNRSFAPDHYTLTLNYPSFTEKIPHQPQPRIKDTHKVEIILTADYPRRAPLVRWRTPIFHPNIRPEDGTVCLGVLYERYLPGMGLARLVRMLIEMIQWRNFDVTNAFNKEAAHWAANMRHWQYIQAIDGYPYQGQQAISDLMAAVQHANQPKITFRPLIAPPTGDNP